MNQSPIKSFAVAVLMALAVGVAVAIPMGIFEMIRRAGQ